MRQIPVASRWLLALLLLISAAKHSPAAGLEDELLPRLKSHRGKVAMAVKHLSKGEKFEYQAAEPMPTASLIKLPVMIEAYRQAAAGKLDLNAKITLKDEDKVPGSGILTPHFSAGTELPVKDAIRLMMAYSDNTATNLVLEEIGLKSTNDAMETLGFPNTKIHAKVFRRDTSIAPDRSEKFGLGSTTAGEMVELLEKLHAGKFADEARTKEMIEHLSNCQDTSRFPRFLPAGTKVAHKTGSVSRIRTDAGIIFSPSGPIALCVLTSENQDQRWVDDNAGSRLCADVAKIVFDYFHPRRRLASGTPEQLKLGDAGPLVEDLQRTLNARLNPEPKISVDGEFGTETQSAVERFQRNKELTINGIVAAETWKALGPLVTNDPPVPAPEVINSQELPITEADPLTGPPVVTCKSWAIADTKTGKLLAGHDSAKPKDIASTTKMMTAFLVLRLAQKEPAVLDEELTFSERADRTGGSTSAVRAGERLSVRELLYGLMLPSGNDASVALAEHFGKRLAPEGSDAETSDPLELFVSAMNQAAKELGMENTTYKNPHGLTARGHLSTAEDLAKLAHAAIQLPLYCQYINTRQHGCTLVGAGGYQRNIVWKNTNQLLGIEGYRGIKTGTTSAAGACLVSWGERGEDSCLVVVLGATSGDARYVDTRNLFRWWWREGASAAKSPRGKE